MNTHAFSLLLLGKGSIKLPKYDRNLTHFQYYIKLRCYIFFEYLACDHIFVVVLMLYMCVVVFWTYTKRITFRLMIGYPYVMSWEIIRLNICA